MEEEIRRRRSGSGTGGGEMGKKWEIRSGSSEDSESE